MVRCLNLTVDQLTVEILFKRIRNAYLRVLPSGVLRVTVPLGLDLLFVTKFIQSRHSWIIEKQRTISKYPPPIKLNYNNGDYISVWGKLYPIKLSEISQSPFIALQEDHFHIATQANASNNDRHELLMEWYKKEMHSIIPLLLMRWVPRLGIPCPSYSLRLMKTRWGSCTPHSHRIRLNLNLAQKPKECFEYVLLHELLHFLEPTHNAYFKSLMISFMPNWKEIHGLLNKDF